MREVTRVGATGVGLRPDRAAGVIPHCGVGELIDSRSTSPGVPRGSRAAGVRVLVLLTSLLVGTEARSGAGPAEGQVPAGLPKGPRRSAEFQESVNRAIDAGVAWLRKQQDPDGRFRKGIQAGVQMSAPLRKYGIQDPFGGGPTALAVLTLRVCGVGADDAGVRKGLDALRVGYPAGRDFTDGVTVYGTSLTLLALEAHYERDAAGVRAVPESDLEWMSWLVQELEGAQTTTGGFGYYGPHSKGPGKAEFGHLGGYWDNSNSQFALLGLAAARQCGVKVRQSTWERALRHWMNQQEQKGPVVARFEDAGEPADGVEGGGPVREVGKSRARGWTYSRDSRVPSGAMTAGGVSSIALCRSALSESKSFRGAVDRESLEAMQDGLAWLGVHFQADRNPMGAGSTSVTLFHLYYLYALERAGVLADTAWMGRRDWYGEGATHLVKAQLAEGSWEEKPLGPGIELQAVMGKMPLVDTCFALLFLKRATTRLGAPTVPDRTTATPTGTTSIELEAADRLGEKEFERLFQDVFQCWSSREAVSGSSRPVDEFVRLGPRVVPCLIRRLEDESPAVRRSAAAVLRAVCHDGPVFEPDASPEARGEAVASWEAWWFKRRPRLVRDLAGGAFVEMP